MQGSELKNKNNPTKNIKNKILIQQAVGKVFQEFKGRKSNYLFGAEYDISTSLLNHVERGIKDPQLTTIFKLAQALGLQPSEFVRRVEDYLPDDFNMIEE